MAHARYRWTNKHIQASIKTMRQAIATMRQVAADMADQEFTEVTSEAIADCQAVINQLQSAPNAVDFAATSLVIGKWLEVYPELDPSTYALNKRLGAYS